jgi:uncharacterized protein (DUF2141 family)
MDTNTKLVRGNRPRFARELLMPVAGGAALLAAAIASPAAAQYHQEIGNDMRRCDASGGPAVLVMVDGIKSSTGKLRVQSYRATAADWLQKGRWLTRTDLPARAGSMSICVPVPAAGNYAIAIRHDVDGSGGTDLFKDGGGMSNNPAINIFNLGKPSVSKTSFPVGPGVKTIRIRMRYM